jgi:hypothetical protein
MTLIKKYWKLITGSILTLFGIGLLATKQTETKVAAIDHEIEHNNDAIDKIDTEVVAIEKTKTKVVKNIATKKAQVNKLEIEKTIVPKTYKTVAEAKQNIIKKTQRTK